jgi:integrase/recombinase XerD
MRAIVSPSVSMKAPELGPWLQRFFREHLLTHRNLSPATITAYRDTFRLLLQYLRKSHSRPSFSLPLDVLTPDTVVRFLEHLERQRGNCIRTRNARLAAIRSFIHYLSDWLGPDLPTTVARIPGIPFKRHTHRLITFLSPQEVEAILAATDETWTGQRDHLLFLLLFNTGARISEILSLRVMNVNVDGRQIELLGKGRKHRRVPLWPQTQRRLRRWLKDNRPVAEAPLLPNRFGQRLTRAGAAYQLQRLADLASAQVPSLKKRRISPHSFRHGTAMALLEANVPTEVIALYLGHESPQTTHLYVEASLAMKKQALAKVHSPRAASCRFRPTDDDLLFLDDL